MARLPPKPPADPAATDGAAVARQAVVKLHDKGDGHGTNWRAVTDDLFRAAFAALDALPDDACRAVARRVHAGSYERVTDGPKTDSGASNSAQPGAENAPVNTFDLKSNGPDG